MGLHSSIGRALQRWRRGHGFESCWSPEILFGLICSCLNATIISSFECTTLAKTKKCGFCCETWSKCNFTRAATVMKKTLPVCCSSFGTCLVLRALPFYVKFSRTDKMYAFFTRIGAQIWNSIPYSIQVLKRSSFRKKIKELLLNFLRSEDDYVEVSRLIKLFNT